MGRLEKQNRRMIKLWYTKPCFKRRHFSAENINALTLPENTTLGNNIPWRQSLTVALIPFPCRNRTLFLTCLLCWNSDASPANPPPKKRRMDDALLPSLVIPSSPDCIHQPTGCGYPAEARESRSPHSCAHEGAVHADRGPGKATHAGWVGATMHHHKNLDRPSTCIPN